MLESSYMIIFLYDMSYRNKNTYKRVLYDHHMGLLVFYRTKHIGSLVPQCVHMWECKKDVLVFFFTLRTASVTVACWVKVGGSTLGDVALIVGSGNGIWSMRFNWVASVTRAFRTEYSAANLGVVVEGGSVRINIMSLAACRRKSYNFTSIKGMLAEKKRSQYRSLLMF